ncbi:MAG: GlmU family protein [Cytophaga sp.]|uniref:GlmU family protein n=1 Tax=Cytophaga sp. TaxID=29535 RepID=UPI003F7DDDF5
MNILFFDEPALRKALLPLTFTRPAAELRIGIYTIREKWQQYFSNAHCFFKTEPYLQAKYPLTASAQLHINGCVCPNEHLVAEIEKLNEGEGLVYQGMVLASKGVLKKRVDYFQEVLVIRNPSDLFTHNGAEIRNDFKLITKGRTSCEITDKHTIVYNPSNVFIENGVSIKAAIINAEDGPVYIGKDVEIQEGTIIKGPFAAGQGAVLAMGSKMRGDNTIGPYCKVGGEVSNTIFIGYSNKVHDGFIGNSVIGEWCNLAAGTNVSNLKNNYSSIKVHSYENDQLEDTGKIFHGLIMGDYSRCGINSMFNTGSVVGVSCNIYDAAFPPKFIPSFAWGSAAGFTEFRLTEAFDVAKKGMARRKVELAPEDIAILTHVFGAEAQQRSLLMKTI